MDVTAARSACAPAEAAPMAATTSPCETCDARCCRVYSVHLTGDDVSRIGGGLGLPMQEFVAFAPQRAPTEMGFLLEHGGPTHDLVLRTDGDDAPFRACVFLRALPAGGGRCGAYAFRPRACRRFPAMEQGGTAAVRDGVVCAPGAWDGSERRRAWRVELERERREIALHAAVVAIWNEQIVADGGAPPRTALELLEHLGDAYRFVARLRTALRPRDRSGPAFVERVAETLRQLERL
jgi:Fe-S-cluster containining protein